MKAKQKTEAKESAEPQKTRSTLPMMQIRIREPFADVAPVEIAKLKEEEKLPKENIKVLSGYESIGTWAPRIYCAVRMGGIYGVEASLHVVGEYQGSSNTNLILFILVYNEKHDLIGYDSNEEFGRNSVGHGTFSQYVQVPYDEKISKVVLRFVRKIYSFETI